MAMVLVFLVSYIRVHVHQIAYIRIICGYSRALYMAPQPTRSTGNFALSNPWTAAQCLCELPMSYSERVSCVVLVVFVVFLYICATYILYVYSVAHTLRLAVALHVSRFICVLENIPM